MNRNSDLLSIAVEQTILNPIAHNNGNGVKVTNAVGSSPNGDGRNLSFADEHNYLNTNESMDLGLSEESTFFFVNFYVYFYVILFYVHNTYA